jgi:hypothetical protein
MNNSLSIAILFAAALVTSACSTSNANSSAKHMGCMALAHEIGKLTQMQESADISSVFGIVEMLASDDKTDQITAGIESLIGDIAGVTAKNELEELDVIYARKGCS